MKMREFKDFKIAYREETDDETILRDDVAKNFTLGGIPEYKLNPEDVIIDIGAHIGTFTILAASKLKNGKVYAIEPSRENFEYLKKNVDLNNFSNVFISNLALADFKGVARLYHAIGTRGHSITKKFSKEYEEITTETLGNFLINNHIVHCDFLKCNCEGAEFKIILSTPKSVLERIKIIFIKYHLDCADGYSEKDLIKHLKKCNFSCTIRYRSNKRGWLIAGKTADFSLIARGLNCCLVYLRRLRRRCAIV